jgi:hypothetical protein
MKVPDRRSSQKTRCWRPMGALTTGGWPPICDLTIYIITKKGYRCAALALALLMTLPLAVGAQTNGEPERFTAFVVNMTNSAAGTNSTLEIIIDRWSTEADREALAIAFDELGTGGLLKMMQERPRVGYMRVPNKIGVDLAFARQVPHADGGRRILIVTARRLTFNEVNASAPTADYPFTVIELDFKPDGVGAGKMSVGTKIRLHRKDDLIELDNYDPGWFLLNYVKAAKK